MAAVPDDLQALVAGAAAGLAATGAMSAVMVAAREAGLMSELPPHEITSKAVDRAGAGDDVSHEERRELGWVAHFLFGALGGATYGLLRRRVPTPGPGAAYGATYALGIWAVSYMGWIPALRFLPPATDDEPGRQPSMIAAHLVFGSVLGMLVERAVRRLR